ncbi:uncharacterized protein LOC142777437 [Rhipicephalus microplus]|uniref:uncharacterized protein LOC142777437 n=1 Tax=Rhipicephalus microplus TaxID=6941 RepID=UPI003F6B718E
MASAGYSSSTSLTEETPPRAASPPAAQPYQALSNQKLSVQAKKVAYNVCAQVRKSDPQLSVRAACRKVSELTGVSERGVFRIKLDVNSGTLKSPKTRNASKREPTRTALVKSKHPSKRSDYLAQ